MRKQIQIFAATYDSEALGVLSFDWSLASKFVFDVQSFDNFAVDKQDVRSELRGSSDEFLAEVSGIKDALTLRFFIVLVADDVLTPIPPFPDTLFQNVRMREHRHPRHFRNVSAQSGPHQRLIEFILVIAKTHCFCGGQWKLILKERGISASLLEGGEAEGHYKVEPLKTILCDGPKFYLVG